MADDLRVRVVWQNDEASLRQAMAQAQQILQQVQGNVGYGSGGMPTPASVGAQGQIRAQAPTGLLNAQGNPVGTTTATITAPQPSYNATATSGTGTSYAAQQGQPNTPTPRNNQGGQRGGSGLARMSGPLGYAGRFAAIRTIYGGLQSIGEAAEQQQSLSNINRRIGEGAQQWRAFEDQILKVGVGLGATRAQMIELTNTFVSSVGKIGTQQTAQVVRGGMELAKTMGIAPESVVGFMGDSARHMSNPDYNKLGAVLYTAVQSGMQGREEEVIKAIEDLTDMMGKRLPDFGPGGIGGIGETLRAFSATGIPGMKGAFGAEKAGTLNEFIAGGGSDIQNNIRMMFAAQEARAQGLPTDPLSLMRALEGGINEPFGQAVAKRISGTLPEGIAGDAALSSIMGLGGIRNAEAVRAGIGNINIGGATLTPPGLDLTQADKNTEAMVSFGRALQHLGEEVLPAVVAADNALAGEINGLGDILSHTNGLLTILGTVIGTLGPIAGIGSMIGLPSPLGLMGKIPGAAGAATAFGGAGVGAGVATGMGLAALGLGAGALLSLPVDAYLHPGEPTTLDMLLQNMGISGLPGQVKRRAKGGLVTSPELTLLGENGPEAVVPMNAEAIGRMMSSMLGGTGDSWRAFAAQFGIETAWGSQMHGNNPFNLRPIKGGWGGQTGVYSGQSGDFATFGSIEDGIRAAANNYLVGNYGYDAVVAAARSGDASAVARAIQNSSWDAGHYGYSSLTNMVGGTMPSGAVGGNHMTGEVTVTVKQPDGSTEKSRIIMSSSSPYRGVVTSPNWGVSF